jgi:radical SAM superfamily enzyme YgiQ (UPF0313 family)
MTDITLINLNMLFMRYGQEIERELHVPLGCLYLTRALEAAGVEVDFRDYQTVGSDSPFDMEVFLAFCENPAPVIGLSCMANLLPFSILAMRALKQRYPDRLLVLGGVGSKAVEEQILRRFPWIDIICRGEGELTAPHLLHALRAGGKLNGQLAGVPGISYPDSAGVIRHNPDRPRIQDLDAIGFPAWNKVDLKKYAGYGMMTSRGCPYPCTFCSVAPVWNMESHSRSPANIVEEMEELHRRAGVDLFLFQDEFFVSGKKQVMDFCREITRRKLSIRWKAFGRVNLTDEEMMREMAACGCVELRFGIESGSDRVLEMVKKGFTAQQVMEVVPKAIEIFPRVDAFYVWGFPFETMEDFNQSLFQMVSFRMLGARILPSLLSLLPQTEVYRQCVSQYELEFCPYLLPEFVFTGHEITRGGEVEIPAEYREYFQLIQDNPDIFPGFFHVDLANNVLPKLALLRQFGFYPQQPDAPAQGQLLADLPAERESCGAHSAKLTTGSQ